MGAYLHLNESVPEEDFDEHDLTESDFKSDLNSVDAGNFFFPLCRQCLSQ